MTRETMRERETLSPDSREAADERLGLRLYGLYIGKPDLTAWPESVLGVARLHWTATAAAYDRGCRTEVAKTLAAMSQDYAEVAAIMKGSEVAVRFKAACTALDRAIEEVSHGG